MFGHTEVCLETRWLLAETTARRLHVARAATARASARDERARDDHARGPFARRPSSARVASSERARAFATAKNHYRNQRPRARGRRRDARDDDDGVHRLGDDDDVEGVFVGDVLAVRAVLARGGSSRGRLLDQLSVNGSASSAQFLRNLLGGAIAGGQRGCRWTRRRRSMVRDALWRALGGGDAFGDVGYVPMSTRTLRRSRVERPGEDGRVYEYFVILDENVVTGCCS